MKITILLTIIFGLNSCTSVKDSAKKIKPNIGKCPEQSERTLKDLFCSEAK